MKMKTNATASKVWASAQAGTGGAAVATVLIWLLNEYAHVEMPTGVELAFSSIVVGLFTFVASWAAGYFKSPAQRDVIIAETEEQVKV